jgi:hypothetical protein
MHFHFCGNILHDLVHNFLVLLALMPEAVPLLGHLHQMAIAKFKRLHEGQTCCEEVYEQRVGGEPQTNNVVGS